MYQDLIQLISHYLDIDEIYRLKELLKLRINIYLKNVSLESNQSYIDYKNMIYRAHEEFKEHKDLWIDWASSYGYLEVVKYLFSTGKKATWLATSNASEKGYLEILKCLISGKTQISDDIISFATEFTRDGNTELFEFVMVEIGIEECEIGNVVRAGHLDMLNRFYFDKIRKMIKFDNASIIMEYLFM